MLAFLRVKGFAIIDELDVEFKEGLNVITGETGAGKSIIINALSSLLHARAPGDVIRSAATQAEVTGHCFQDGEEYILRRIIGSQGRSRAYVNDDPVTAKRLEEVGDLLIHLYGQHESQQLLSKETYISLVDRFLGLLDETASLADQVRRLKDVTQIVEARKKEAAGQSQEMDLLIYQLDEIEREDIKDGEEESIKDRLKVLRDRAKIKASLEAIGRGLYEEEQSVQAVLGASMGLLRPFSGVEWISALSKRLEGLSIEVTDIFRFIAEQEKNLEYEPGEQEALEERQSVIFKLKEKYGKIHGGIKEFAEWAQKRLDSLKGLKTNVEELEKERTDLLASVESRASKISAARKKGASRIEKLVCDELAFLSMKGVKFKVEITERAAIGEDGKDEVEFMLSANPGEPLRPLRKTASGGELSRIMLAIKKITGGDEDKTFIFDEIDAGIGGRVAEVVGKRLRELARKHQIICITHLPQIAVFGDHHFLVKKHQEKDATNTSIEEVRGRDRTAEVARMLGGVTITDKTIERAEEMLRHAQESAYQ